MLSVDDKAKLFDYLANDLHVGQFQVNELGQYVSVDPNWLDIINLTKAEALETSWLNSVHSEDYAYIYREWQNLVVEKQPFYVRYRLKNSREKITYVGGYITSIETDKTPIYHGVLWDATREETLQREKDRFFSIIACDLRGPAAPLVGNLEFMAENYLDLTPEDRHNCTVSGYHSAKRIYAMLGNLMVWSRLIMGRGFSTPQRLNLYEIVTKSLTSSTHETGLLHDRAIIKQITLSNNVAEEIWVYVDDYLLDKIIEQLVDNALKFTPSGGKVNISATPKPLGNIKGNFIEVTVTDTGIGIPLEIKQQLFDVKGLTQRLGTNQESGAGLGLIICREMVNKYGGQIWVESEVGQGTTVKFTIPTDASQV